MTFAQRRNRLTTDFSERIPVVKRRMTAQTRSNHPTQTPPISPCIVTELGFS